MQWFKELCAKRDSGSACLFLLHLNTPDLVLQDGRLEELNDFLKAQPPLSEAHFLAGFTRARGIHFLGEHKEADFERFLEKIYPEKIPNGNNIAVTNFRRFKTEVAYMLGLFSKMLEIGWGDARLEHEDLVDLVGGKELVKGRREKKSPFFAAIIDQTELLVPPRARESGTLEDRTSLSAFLDWGKRSAIADAGNLAIFVAEDLCRIADELASDTRAIIPIEIQFQTRQDREATIHALARLCPRAFSYESDCDEIFSLDTNRLARISNGLPRRSLHRLVRESAHRGVPLEEARVFAEKQEHLKIRLQGIASLRRSPWGNKAIGGMQHNVDFIHRVTKALVEGDVSAVPQNILLIGPKGTGKTVMAEAISYETGMDLIILERLHDMFVGEAERRTKHFFDTAKSYVPVIVFIDEIHLFFLRQGTYFSGDTGVTERIQKAFLEITSDTSLRGQLLVIGATNHPELIDDAFIRPGRFDTVRVCLPMKTPEERALVIPAVLHKLACQAKAAGESFNHEITEEFCLELARSFHWHFLSGKGWQECSPELDRDKSTIVTPTGAELEYVVTHGVLQTRKEGRKVLLPEDLRWSAEDILPNRDMNQFQTSIDAALWLCNSREAIPPEWLDYAMEVRGQPRRSGRGDISINTISTGVYL